MSSAYAFLTDPTDAPALVDAAAERVITQRELAEIVKTSADPMVTGRRELVFCLSGGRDYASVIGYLSSVHAGHAVAMLDGRIPAELTEALIQRYRPAFVVDGTDGRNVQIREGPGPHPAVDDDLLIMLSTSGTTGSPKLARLSRTGVDWHNDALIEYLEIDAAERPIQSLPIHFSYGLSVLNSHLAAGASVILSPYTIVQPQFWADAARWGATSFSGVPYSYAILDRAGLLRKAMPDTMRTLTQSGGRHPPEAIVELHEMMAARGGRLYVMYGVTETVARCTWVPPAALPEKAHCVGIPIPGGKITIESDGREATEPEVEGEVVYHGPNVMLGYAEQPEDLSLGDRLGGVYRTGDVGILDSDGFLRLTGRIKRIAKVYGLRISLDEIEAAAAGPHGLVAAVEGRDRIVLWRLAGQETPPDDLARQLAQRFNLNSRAFDVRDLDELPLTGRGKPDYKLLAERSAD